jgi:hypothetical protein
MSARDRIELTLNEHAFPKMGRKIIQEICGKAFGLSATEVSKVVCGGGLRIRVRPSQFGLFIMLRHKEGCSPNRITVLEPELITVNDDCVLDVSKRCD